MTLRLKAAGLRYAAWQKYSKIQRCETVCFAPTARSPLQCRRNLLNLYFIAIHFFKIMSTVLHLSAALLAVGLFFISSQLSIHASSEHTAALDSTKKHLLLRSLANHLNFARIRDTVYVLGERFIEVNLSTQHATLRYRNGDSLLIPISTGHITNDGGIITPSGIFSVQGKSPEAISRQFGNTKMLWWVGFNYNVGFHGLEASSYYRHLGQRPSSHGCVRTGREDVLELYKRVSEGDPVIVFDGEPARILAFADTVGFDTTSAYKLNSRTKAIGKLMDERLRLLYDGERIARQNFSVYIPLAKQLRPGGFAVGSRDSLMKPQAQAIIFAERVTPMPLDYFRLSDAAYSNAADIRPQEKQTAVDSTNHQQDSTTALPKKNARKKRH